MSSTRDREDGRAHVTMAKNRIENANEASKQPVFFLYSHVPSNAQCVHANAQFFARPEKRRKEFVKAITLVIRSFIR